MPTTHVVVDGSNIATEGRSLPSLAQLEGAIEELRQEMPESIITVVVDATFAHRIDPSERPRFEAAALRGEYVSPPAGAIGRGDAFILRIAEKVNGIALSNDSFQEFHGDHGWLFEPGRLIGASPVPGVGWIFIPRTPVRGPRSRVAVRTSSRAKKSGGLDGATLVDDQELEAATDESPGSSDQQGGEDSPIRETRRRTTRTRPENPEPVNDPATFITFIAEHPLGKLIEAEVESFTSHGAVIRYGAVHCYAPLAALGNPPPRSARGVLHRGETRTFVVVGLDPQRRGVELALPGVSMAVTTADALSESTQELEPTQQAAKRAPRRVTSDGAEGVNLLAEGEQPAARASRGRRVATGRGVVPEISATQSSAPTEVAARSRGRKTSGHTAPVDDQSLDGAASRAAQAPAPRSRSVQRRIPVSSPIDAPETPTVAVAPKSARSLTEAPPMPVRRARGSGSKAPSVRRQATKAEVPVATSAGATPTVRRKVGSTAPRPVAKPTVAPAKAAKGVGAKSGAAATSGQPQSSADPTTTSRPRGAATPRKVTAGISQRIVAGGALLGSEAGRGLVPSPNTRRSVAKTSPAKAPTTRVARASKRDGKT